MLPNVNELSEERLRWWDDILHAAFTLHECGDCRPVFDDLMEISPHVLDEYHRAIWAEQRQREDDATDAAVDEAINDPTPIAPDDRNRNFRLAAARLWRLILLRAPDSIIRNSVEILAKWQPPE